MPNLSMLLLGFLLVVLGMVLLTLAAARRGEGRAVGVVLVGPIPIVFGGRRLATILVIILLILFSATALILGGL